MCGTKHVPWEQREQYALERTLLDRLGRRVEARDCPPRFALMEYARANLVSPEQLQVWPARHPPPIPWHTHSRHKTPPESPRGMPSGPGEGSNLPGPQSAVPSARFWGTGLSSGGLPGSPTPCAILWSADPLLL